MVQVTLDPPQLAVPRLLAPDVGALVEYGLDGFGKAPARYRVTGWMRAAQRPQFGPGEWIAEILHDGCRKHRDGKRLQWCLREEAEYVTLAGICGAIAPVAECKVTGTVGWPKEQIDEARAHAVRLGQAHRMLV